MVIHRRHFQYISTDYSPIHTERKERVGGRLWQRERRERMCCLLLFLTLFLSLWGAVFLCYRGQTCWLSLLSATNSLLSNSATFLRRNAWRHKSLSVGRRNVMLLTNIARHARFYLLFYETRYETGCKFLQVGHEGISQKINSRIVQYTL